MERLDLNFRAEPARPKLFGLSAGWWLWCLVGLAVGYGVWWTSRQYLTRRLGDQLAAAQSPSDAFLALEGLLMLDASATLEITRGLQHPNAQVARTAYRTLDAQISSWSQLQSGLAAARMRNLSQRLSELPETTPPDNLILASSLASRIFSLCLELDDPQLAPVMTTCEAVFQRIGRVASTANPPATSVATSTVAANTVAATVVSAQDLQQLEQQINALRPPPPLAQTTTAAGAPATSLAATSLTTLPTELTSIGNTSTDNTPMPALAPREGVHSSSSTPTAQVQFLTAATRPRAASLSDGQARGSLSDASGPADASFSLSDDADADDDSASPQPTLVHGPASVDSQPLARMQQLKVDVELENIQQLEIDQLVRLLGSVQPRVAQAAALALRSRGFPDDRLVLASELATALPQQQLALLQAIATRTDLDPRPWLLWMAEEGTSEVKQQAVALLSSMADDVEIQRDLRRLLAQESDARVAHTLRQVLLNR